MASDPERIWLQGCGDEGCEDEDCPAREWEGRTWCQDQIHDNDTEYVRADLLAALERDHAKLQESYLALYAERDAAEAQRAELERERDELRRLLGDARERISEWLESQGAVMHTGEAADMRDRIDAQLKEKA